MSLENVNNPKDSARNSESPLPSDRAAIGEVDQERRSFLATSSLLMGGGLLAGYGTFFTFAGRFLFPSRSNKVWMFVADAAGISPGQSLEFVSPTGVAVAVTRRADSPADGSPTVNDFLALSSVCPHLGCRVQWEAHNNRFFCPCHNGVFDPDGQAVSGPPAAENQRLSRYSLEIVDGSLYIEMPFASVGSSA